MYQFPKLLVCLENEVSPIILFGDSEGMQFPNSSRQNVEIDRAEQGHPMRYV